MEELSVGTRIYFRGDIDNQPAFGTIKNISRSEWGVQYIIQFDGEDCTRSVSSNAFSEKYLGHGGTRFVTEQAYYEFRKLQATGEK